MKWNAQVDADVTFNFEIEADSEEQVEAAIKRYLPYIQYGKLENQPISVKVDDGDKLRSIFVMDKEIEDVYELD